MDFNAVIAAATVTTAILLAAQLMLSWRLYRLGLEDTGRSNPVILGKARPLVQRFHPEGLGIEYILSDDRPEEQWHRLRVIQFYVYNRSAITQHFTFDELRVLWPLRNGYHRFGMGDSLEFPPHAGGNVPFVITKDDWLNAPSPERIRPDNIFVIVTAETLSGHRMRHFGWATVGQTQGHFYDGV